MDPLDWQESNSVTSVETIERGRRSAPMLMLFGVMMVAVAAAVVLTGSDSGDDVPGQSLRETPQAQPESSTGTTTEAEVATLPSLEQRGLQPPDRCETLVGAEPLVTVRTPNPWISCTVVGDFQRLVLWNNGTEIMKVAWPSGSFSITTGAMVGTEQAGQIFPVGPSKVDSSPYLIPTIWLAPPEASPTAGLSFDGESFGPITVGMTVDDAELALGRVIEPTAVEGWPASCWFVADDPYSPVFVVDDEAGGADTMVLGLIDPKSGGETVGIVDACL